MPIGQSFTICRSEDCVWFYRENDLFYTKDNNLFYSFIKFPQGYIRQFDQDSSYVYVLFDEKLVIFNKNYIFKNSILFEYEEHNQLVKMYFEESRIINDSIQNIEKFINSVKLLKKNEDYNKYEDLCAMINNLPSQLENAIYNDNVLNTINLLEKGTIEGEYRFFILKGLCKYYLTKADISNSLNFFKKIKQEFPDINDRCIEYSYESALKYNHSLDSLYALNLTPDSLIFRQAHLRMKLIESSCWFGESWYRLNIVEDKYKELLVKFPNSKLADNAELWLLEYQFYGDEGGLPHESISHFKDFKKKYPDSDVLSNVALNIFHAYMNSDSENPDTIIFNYDCAIHELENALPSLKNDTLKYKMILSTLRELQNGKNSKIFKIELKSEKVKYLKGEDIVITTKIINLLSKSQKIKLYKNSSMLTFSINNENVKDCFIPSATSDENMIEHTFSREMPIIQKIVLNKDARHWDKGRNGKFNIIKPGNYYISAMDGSLNLDSNQIQIIVE
ncbi:MAG: hypothetical protein IPH57_15705 [Saprospiraceae bacterium]|nr:hypothetical protein [Saprospiraceae bacterium]